MSGRKCPRCDYVLSRADSICPVCGRGFSVIDTQEIKRPEDSEVRHIPVNRLRVLPEVQFRVKLDPQAVEYFAGMYRKHINKYTARFSDQLPPVLVVADGENGFIVADGFHRVEAAKSISEEYLIPATVTSPYPSHGAVDTAIHLACLCNCRFFVQRTEEDKARAVAMYLSLPGHADMPDGALAEELNVYNADIIQKGRALYNEWHAIKSYKEWDAAKSGKKPEGRSAEELAGALHKTHIQFMEDLKALAEKYMELSNQIILGLKQ